MINIVYNSDCLPAMRKMRNNQFDLAVVDVPYGFNYLNSGGRDTKCKNPKHNRKHYYRKNWDINIPPKEYFEELFRISKNQIIWGANYFTEYLKGSMGWVFWYKGQSGLTMSDGELAYTSFNRALRQVTINRVELLVDGTIHPTQKPVKLYKWLLKNYAKEGDTILDTHVGSGSSRIACWEMEFDFVGYEIDKDYWEAQEKRFTVIKNQIRIF